MLGGVRLSETWALSEVSRWLLTVLGTRPFLDSLTDCVLSQRAITVSCVDRVSRSCALWQP